MQIKKRYILIGAGILAAAALFTQGLGRMKGIKTTGAEVVTGTVEDYYTEEGTLTFGQPYTVIAKVSGPVREVCVRENTPVKQGDLLFVIDDRDIQYEKTLCESTLSGLRAQLEQTRINQLLTASPQEYMTSLEREQEAAAAEYQSAKTVYEAAGTLYTDGSMSKVEWEQKKALYETARVAWQQTRDRYSQSREMLSGLSASGIDEATVNARFYDSALAAISAEIRACETSAAQIEDQLKDCRVTADRDGVITAMPVKEMSAIQAGTAAAVLSGHEKMQVEAEVLTSIAPYIKPGDPVTVTLKLRGKDSSYEGTISEVYQYAAKGTSALGLDEYRVLVKADLNDNQDLTDKNGYDVTVRFRLYTGDDKLWVPASSVFRTGNQDYVFTIEQGKAMKTPVELEYQTSTQAVIAGGLERGNRVIDKADTEGIYDGARVYE